MTIHVSPSMTVLHDIFTQDKHAFAIEFTGRLIRGTLCCLLIVAIPIGIYDYYVAFKELHREYKAKTSASGTPLAQRKCYPTFTLSNLNSHPLLNPTFTKSDCY